MSWSPEVLVKRDNEWVPSGGLRFATKEETEGHLRRLKSSWTEVADIRAVESEDPVNYRWSPSKGLEKLEDVSDVVKSE